MEGLLPLKGGPIGYLKSIKRGSLDSGIYLTPDAFPLLSGRKVKAVVCPYRRAGLSQNIAFGAVLDIAYSALGNLYERLIYGEVVDYFDFYL